ncbi:MAG: hypothetical protein JWR19_1652 [Pedosphaera sp.]|nr:hypothetical protein [Pedosphaera sp.]
MRKAIKVGLSLLVFMAICGAAGYFYFWHSPLPRMPQLSANAQRATLRVGDRDRTYLSYIPANLPRGAPLVIVLHGSVMDGTMMREWTGYEFDQMADQFGFAVVYPDGYKHDWNVCWKNATFPAKIENVDDMGFITALIDRFRASHGIDPGKVFAFGYSNGGHMAFRLAAEAPDEVAAVAAVAANLPTPDSSSCPQTGRTARIMLVDGTKDPINPYDGGKITLFGFSNRGVVLSAPASAESLARRNSATGTPVEADLPRKDANDPTAVDLKRWANGNTPIVELYTVTGGGHVVPQPVFRFPRLLGRTTSELDAPRAALLFFGITKEY